MNETFGQVLLDADVKGAAPDDAGRNPEAGYGPVLNRCLI